MTNSSAPVIIRVKGDLETVYRMILTGVHHRRAGALAAVIFLAIAQHAAADGLRAGQWHTVQTPEINGMIGPPQKGTRCLTPEAVADLDTTFSPVSRTTNSSCERVEHELTPQRLKWRLQCTGQIDMDVEGEFKFEDPEHYVAIITARSFMQGRLMQSVRTSIAGQRVGDCP
jgi:hypothetical protein